MSKSIRDDWKVIRSLIFSSELDLSTLPRECASAMKGFYYKKQ